MHTKAIQFYFDYISPNAYLAWTQLPRFIERYDVAIEPVPVLFTGLLRAHGQMGPAEQPAKLDWMAKNIARKASQLDIPLKPPRFHPFNPLLALRLSCLELNPSDRWRLIDCFFTAAWAEQEHLSDEAAVQKLLDLIGLDGADLVARAGAGEASEKLKRNTERAVERGVFGIPSMLAGNELFFGYDDFSYLELFLQGKDPLQSEQSQHWLNASWTASSVRREMRASSAEISDQ